MLHVFSPAPVAAFGPGPVVFEPIVLTPVDRDQLLADTKAFAETESAPRITIDAALREGNTADEILDQAHTWMTGGHGHQADALSFGPPHLQWSFNRDGEAKPRDRHPRRSPATRRP